MKTFSLNKSLLDAAGYKNEEVKAYVRSHLNYGELRKFASPRASGESLLLPDATAPRDHPRAGHFSYLPWIGRNYPGGLRNRACFIAESYFKSNDNWDYYDYGCVGLAEFITNEYIPRPYPKFFAAINPIMSELAEGQTVKDFVFANAVYMNICQRCMQSSAARPSKAKTKKEENDYISGWRTWFTAARILRPTLCICNGLESAGCLEIAAQIDGKVTVKFSSSERDVDADKNRPEGDTSGLYKTIRPIKATVQIDNDTIEFIWMLHSTHNGRWDGVTTFKPLKWREYLMEQNSFADWGREMNSLYL